MNCNDFDARSLAISIVSHGQGDLLRPLLEDLLPLANAGAKMVLTLNLPEDERFLTGIDQSLVLIRNRRPLGFGANHNQAFRQTERRWFAVINPDVRCDSKVFAALVAALSVTQAAVAAPRVTGPHGADEDSVRRFPSLARIVARVIRRQLGQRLQPDYHLEGEVPRAVDWAAGMFMLFDSAAYREIGGFDERYYMYLEDADICRRLRWRHREVVGVPSVSVIHDAQRASGKSLQHLRWHLASMGRFLFLAPWTTPPHPLASPPSSEVST